jgi:hypothetical protein
MKGYDASISRQKGVSKIDIFPYCSKIEWGEVK